MDMVWLDTMFPGIDEEEGWEENMKRVVNYDYLLKEYLDWQLKHLTTDNFDQVDWANVTADIISMAAQSVDLTAYYTKDEADNKSQLLLQAAEDYTQAQLASYYTASEVEGAISTQADLTLTAAEGYVDTQLLSYYTANQVDGAISAQATLSQQAAENYVNTTLQSYYTANQVDGAISAQATLSQTAAETYTNTQLGSYYTKTEIGDFTGYQTAVAALQAYANAAVANVDLTAAYNYTDGKIGNIGNYASIQAYADALISGLSLTAQGSGNTARLSLMSGQTELGNGASLSLSVTNNSNGYSYVKLKSGSIDLATSGNITLGGNVVFTNTDISDLSSSSGIVQGVTSIVGDTVTTSYINALNVTAKTIKANASISSPTIEGGFIIGSRFYSADEDSYFLMGSDGWTLMQKTSGSWYSRAYLSTSSNAATLSLGNSTPAVFEKYYDSGHYLWLGNSSRSHGLLINLSTGAYSFS